MDSNKETIQHALEIFGNSMPKVIELTLCDADNFMAEISGALDEGDAETIRFSAHSLKSIMRQIEAVGVADIAYELEKQGKEGNIHVCRELFETVTPIYEETKSFLLTL